MNGGHCERRGLVVYDYRRMTVPQKRAVVAERRARGFPLHKPPHFRQGGAWYFVSGATFEHRLQFRAPAELTALGNRLLEALSEASIPAAAWVVMPNHYHALVYARNLALLGKRLGSVHGRSARYANQRDRTPGRQVWYKYTDRKVRGERHFLTCIHYTIANPVKHGFAKTPSDWPWSCLEELYAEYGRAWVEDLRHDYPLLDFGRGWDD